MRFSETIASDCRYGSIAGQVWGDWEILWEDSASDYQGHASFLARNPKGAPLPGQVIDDEDSEYCFYEWHYGSCSGCDTWEAERLTHEEIAATMRSDALWLRDEYALRLWGGMLASTSGSPELAQFIRGYLQQLPAVADDLRRLGHRLRVNLTSAVPDDEEI